MPGYNQPGLPVRMCSYCGASGHNIRTCRVRQGEARRAAQQEAEENARRGVQEREAEARRARREREEQRMANRPRHPPERDEDEMVLYHALQRQQQEILDQGDAEAVQNVMQRWGEERQEEERHIQGLPEERQAELRQGWEEERQAELRRVRDLQMQDARRRPGVVERPREFEPRETATDNELARMVALPVLRETAVEATECPVCIEDLGEVGKTVLKCGHTLCVSCFLQQIMRATRQTRARECKCPVCRVGYIV